LTKVFNVPADVKVPIELRKSFLFFDELRDELKSGVNLLLSGVAA
jgi:hypothetical protein